MCSPTNRLMISSHTCTRCNFERLTTEDTEIYRDAMN